MTREELFQADIARDIVLAGRPLVAPYATRFAEEGAHDPTPTPYFVLDELLASLHLGEGDHLLDAGCGCGRVLAYATQCFPAARATGVELDPKLARIAQAWTEPHPNLAVRKASVLDLDLAPYTHIYLFNPFNTAVLARFLDKLAREARRPVTLVHMSDNGETYSYIGRPGFSLMFEGSIQSCRTAQGEVVEVFGCPQHWSRWRFTP